jgi:hypothetical protein
MISLRECLTKIGILKHTPFSWNSFVSRPTSMKEAIRSMDAPKSWQQVSDINLDEDWTDEVQGVAWDSENWIFSCNANQSKPGHNDKALYLFKEGSSLKDGTWRQMLTYYKDVKFPIKGDEGDSHWGQLTFHEGAIYVSYFYSDGPYKGKKYVFIFQITNGQLKFQNWVPIGQVKFADGSTGYPEFQGINPWDGLFYTCRGGEKTKEFYIHRTTGEWTGKVLKFSGGEGMAQILRWVPDPPHAVVEIVDLPSNVQGACFSPNGHLYIACDLRLKNKKDYKVIACFSALNGHLMSIIPVLADQDNQELQGVCYGGISSNGSQMHVILLENELVALDNIFFKSFRADRPELT